MKLSNANKPTSSKMVKLGQAMVAFGAAIAVISGIDKYPIIALGGGLIGALGMAITIFSK